MMQPVLNYDARRPFVRLRAEAMVLLAVLLVSLLLFLANGVSGLLIAHVWSSYAAGLPLNPAEDHLSILLATVGQMALPSTLAIWIVLAIWMYRAHQRLWTLYHERRLRFSHVEALIAWFMPWRFAIRPFEVMKEIYAISLGVPIKSFTPVCGCWWGFWLAAEFLVLAQCLAFSNIKASDQGPDLYMSYGIWRAVNTVPILIAGACLAVIVWRVDRAQAHRAHDVRP